MLEMKKKSNKNQINCMYMLYMYVAWSVCLKYSKFPYTAADVECWISTEAT